MDVVGERLNEEARLLLQAGADWVMVQGDVEVQTLVQCAHRQRFNVGFLKVYPTYGVYFKLCE